MQPLWERSDPKKSNYFFWRVYLPMAGGLAPSQDSVCAFINALCKKYGEVHAEYGAVLSSSPYFCCSSSALMDIWPFLKSK